MVTELTVFPAREGFAQWFESLLLRQKLSGVSRVTAGEAPVLLYCIFLHNPEKSVISGHLRGRLVISGHREEGGKRRRHRMPSVAPPSSSAAVKAWQSLQGVLYTATIWMASMGRSMPVVPAV